ncbi:MAG: ATP-binding protein [Thermodesulfobacteriota bacterium]
MSSDQKKPLALLCPLGMTGSIVTETIDALIWLWLEREKGIQWNNVLGIQADVKTEIQNVSSDFYLDVYVLHTDIVYVQKILPKDCTDKDAWMSKLFDICNIQEKVTFLMKYRLATSFPKEAKEPYEPTDWIVFPNIRFVAIPLLNIDTQEILTDIRTDTENRCFQCMLFGMHHCLSQLVRKGHYSQVHISMAGGRKTMSGYTMVSAMMFERMDESKSPAVPRLSHVLTSDGRWEKPFVHQLPPEKYSLLGVPFFPMSDLIPTLLEDYGIDFSDPKLSCEDQLFEKVWNQDVRSNILNVGATYVNNLDQIQQAIGKLIRQGVMFRAIKHDLIDPLKQSKENSAKIAWRAIEAISVLGKERRNLPVPARCNLSELLTVVVDEYQVTNPRFMPSNLTKNIPENIMIDNAPPTELMNHVLFNLFKNTIDQYWDTATDAGKDVTVGLEKSSDDTFERVIYFDNLGGVPQEHRAKIFEYGYSARAGGQRGFGLYLCRMILGLYGGDLSYQDHTHDGQSGAGFIMSFPKTAEGKIRI